MIRCPICGKEFERDKSSALPFCGERCRTIDLGRWLDEKHSMPHTTDPLNDDTAGENGNGRPNYNGD
jgi:hypothetical protein